MMLLIGLFLVYNSGVDVTVALEVCKQFIHLVNCVDRDSLFC